MFTKTFLLVVALAGGPYIHVYQFASLQACYKAGSYLRATTAPKVEVDCLLSGEE